MAGGHTNREMANVLAVSPQYRSEPGPPAPHPRSPHPRRARRSRARIRVAGSRRRGEHSVLDGAQAGQLPRSMRTGCYSRASGPHGAMTSSRAPVNCRNALRLTSSPSTRPHPRRSRGHLRRSGRSDRADGARRAGVDAPCIGPDHTGIDLRWLLVNPITETAHHAGRSDSTRDMLDGQRSGW